jgi:hypothetical protein
MLQQHKQQYQPVSSMSCPNGVDPLLLPIVNVTVSQDGRTNAYGIEFLVGTPAQIVA